MIRLALIGCGGISKSHRARFEAVADRMRVAVTVDIDRARAEEARKTLDAESAVTDFHDALPHVDAVLIATPHHEHYPIGMACLNAKKHVLMEKPLANTEGQCLELIEAAEANGVTLMTAYCMRYHPLTVEMARLIHEKAYGECFHVSLWTEQFTQFEQGSWAHGVETLGGGQFFSHGCHYVDILLHLLGDPVTGVHVGTNFGTPWMEREGTSDAFIKFAGGAVGYHGGTWGAQGTRLGYAFHAQCTDAMIEADFFAGTLKLLRSGQPEELLMETDKSSKYMDKEMSHFLDCIGTGATPLTNGPESLQGLRVIWRIYNGEDDGRIADLRGLGLKENWRFRSPEPLTQTWEGMLPEEFFAAFERAPIAYLSGGAVEDHGPQNALDFDPLTAHAVCLNAAAKSGGIVHPQIFLAPPCLPPLSRAELRTTKNELYKPSLWVRRELCEAYIAELLESLNDFGFKVAIFVAGHYPLQIVAEEIYRTRGDRIGNLRQWGGGIAGLAEIVMPKFAERRNLFGHGMMWETSNMLAVGEHLVEVTRVEKVNTPTFPWPTQLANETDENLAFIGEASAAYGERFYDLAGNYLSRIAAEMGGAPTG